MTVDKIDMAVNGKNHKFAKRGSDCIPENLHPFTEKT
jgi:hypothetical protein